MGDSEKLSRVRARLLEGQVIPAHPLALTAQRRLDEGRARGAGRGRQAFPHRTLSAAGRQAVEALRIHPVGSASNADRTQHVKVNYDLTSSGGSEWITNTDQSLVFQIGANVGDTTTITTTDQSTAATAANAIALSSTANAALAITAVDTAITALSTQRATLGAAQNTFEFTIQNLRNASENHAASRGRIVDADFAAETANLSRAQILQQAGTAMLSQANSAPQNVLTLLR